MLDRTDERIRALVVELAEHAPTAPSFQEIAERGTTVEQPRKPRALIVGAIGVASVALVVGVLLLNRPDDRSSRVRAGAPSTRTSLRAPARPSTEPSTPRAARQGAAAPVPSSVPHYAFAPDAPIPAGYSLTNTDTNTPVQNPPGMTGMFGAWSEHFNSPSSTGTIILEVEVWSGDTSVTAPNTTVHGLPAGLGGAGDLHTIQWSPRPHVSVRIHSLRGAVDESTLHALAEKTVEVAP